MKTLKHQSLLLALCVTFLSSTATAVANDNVKPTSQPQVSESKTNTAEEAPKHNKFRITTNGIFPESDYNSAYSKNLSNLDTAALEAADEKQAQEKPASTTPSFKTQPSHRSHARAYTVKGKRYTPFADTITDFSQEGTASWYGPGFHGKRTANGEKYNQHQMTAAHKELPLNSIVRVTRVSTGESIMVRINDRGPFHGNRIIDLSYGAAKKLGIVNKGKDKVKVELINNNAKGNRKAKTML